jgi:hypothetical protein
VFFSHQVLDRNLALVKDQLRRHGGTHAELVLCVCVCVDMCVSDLKERERYPKEIVPPTHPPTPTHIHPHTPTHATLHIPIFCPNLNPSMPFSTTNIDTSFANFPVLA